MRENTKLFTSIWFIFGLVTLLLNDFVLKEVYGNWLTGKLSDFAGLFIFPLFWTTLFPKYKKKIFILTVIAFVLWKSSYSQILINTWNNIGLWNINRTVDYSDIFALLILPLAYHIEALKEKLFTIRITPFIPLTICIYAFIATVRPTSNTGFDDNTAVYHIKHYSREDFMSELKNLGLDVTSSDYHNTKYYDEHTEINNLNDSIGNLVIMVGDFNKSNQTVEVSLAGWTYTKNPNRMLDDEELENERAYVKSIFEQKVVSKISK
ncbi:hypothetical protein SAMN05444397_109197 [Flavobacterium aquidurense]|uniref:Uncharacterized protein n=1 Tax=Flavobacterium frigidimaris TaxID=262320 RepID=A0ABX4BV19_FLAFR|nr:hypothetical protein [Flavobacterium frigidimaris]OXA81093.1 hypothetical protein B0A65_04940 [Flavobacterium frigidimaris]SDZ58562.1 hypothetical protein SAMN05444397_109197 [Flavobacterium aquidurense]